MKLERLCPLVCAPDMAQAGTERGQGRLGHRLLKYAQLTAPAILVLLPPFSAVTFRAELSLIFVLNLQLFHCDSLPEL